MKLPNAENAELSRAKVVDYLLSKSHLDGRHKAVFFERFGFSAEDWQALADVLRRHPLEYEVSGKEPSRYGMRYAVDGIITAPDGRQPWLRTVWFVDNKDEKQIPRFVSAYPLKRTRNAK